MHSDFEESKNNLIATSNKPPGPESHLGIEGRVCSCPLGVSFAIEAMTGSLKGVHHARLVQLRWARGFA